VAAETSKTNGWAEKYQQVALVIYLIR